MDKLRAKSAALAEAGKAQEAAREAADDLRAFVEVLTTFCDDPRDMAAVRSSEAALKAQLAQLRLELQGGDPQVGVGGAAGGLLRWCAQLWPAAC